MTLDEVTEAVRRAILVADPDHVREVDDAGVSLAQCEAIAVVGASQPLLLLVAVVGILIVRENRRV
jgi:hypothetical protein